MRSLAIVACSFMLMFLTMGGIVAPTAFGAGQEWVLLDENADSSFFYDKAGTGKPDKGVVQVTTRVVYTEEGKADALKTLSASKDLATLYESRYVHELFCAEKESRLLTATHLDKKGTVLKSTDLSRLTEWEAIPPEVRMILVLQEVCP